MIIQQLSLMLQNVVQDEEGQDLIEYALLALLIALAVTAGLIAVGDQLVIVYGQIVTELGGV